MTKPTGIFIAKDLLPYIVIDNVSFRRMLLLLT